MKKSQLPLAGHKILIVGASGSVGTMLALQLANVGAELLLLAKDKGNLERLFDQLQATGTAGHFFLACDLIRLATIPGLVTQLEQKVKKLDGIIFCAGTLIERAAVAHANITNLVAMMNLHFFATQQLLYYLEQLLSASKNPRIVISDCNLPTSSGMTVISEANWLGYQASMAARRQLAASYAAETTNRRCVGIFTPPPTAGRLRTTAFPAEQPPANPLPQLGTQFTTWYLKLRPHQLNSWEMPPA